MNAPHPGHFVRHAAEVMLVLAEAVDELSEEEEEDGHGGAVHHRAGAPRRHEQPVQRVREAEKLVERHALLRPLLHRLAPAAATAAARRLLRHYCPPDSSTGFLPSDDARASGLSRPWHWIPNNPRRGGVSSKVEARSSPPVAGLLPLDLILRRATTVQCAADYFWPGSH
jgi:hypothetical protein